MIPSNLILTNIYLLIVVDSYQYQMESKYQEKSMLTNLFTQNKFTGWLMLFLIFFSIFAIFVFQFLEWESKDNNKK
tara:strand:- start:797 stop:1024 length:228 start_codon:yes stop_codon:yes gene_type:complete